MDSVEQRVYATGHYIALGLFACIVLTACFIAVHDEVYPKPVFTVEPCYGPKGAGKT